MRRHSVSIGVGFFWGIAFACISLSLPLRLNTTDSVPVGWYWENSGRSGPYVGICLGEETLRPALRSGLVIGKGDCPGGLAPILKPLFHASKEQPIVFSEDGFQVNGRWLPNTRPKAVSKEGIALTHAPFGVYTDGDFAISAYNANSWDSRYFGPVDQRTILFYAKPVLTL